MLRLRAALDAAEAAAAGGEGRGGRGEDGGDGLDLLEAMAGENLRCRAESVRLRGEADSAGAQAAELVAELERAEERVQALGARHARAQAQTEQLAVQVWVRGWGWGA